MKLLAICSTFLLVGTTFSTPLFELNRKENQLVVVKEVFQDNFAIYQSEHDIVNIFIPVNQLNYIHGRNLIKNNTIFFIEADVKANGDKDYKGLYVLRDRVATKLLENGRDIAGDNGDDTKVYLAATDGIYVYNAETNKAEKYGSLTDNIIGIAKSNNTDLIYILTEDKIVYKVTEEGIKKEKVESISDAQQIALDYNNNLYFSNLQNKVFVLNKSGVKAVEGLPKSINNLRLLKAPLEVSGTGKIEPYFEGIDIVVNNEEYKVFANGTVEKNLYVYETNPSAYALDAPAHIYFGFEKKIYEYKPFTFMLTIIVHAFSKSNPEFAVAASRKVKFI